MIKIKRGLDLPISGSPRQTIEDGPQITQVALVGYDYPGLKPTMEVQVGDTVKAGQVVFTDKKSPGIKYTSPAAGEVVAINRGPKRTFESLVVAVSGQAAVKFPSFDESTLRRLDRQEVISNLVESGLWPAFRTRPYSKVPDPTSSTDAIFVNASDTRPGAPNPQFFITEHHEAWHQGLDVISRLTKGKVYLCAMSGIQFPLLTKPARMNNPRVTTHLFEGPHPAGNVGTHIHLLHPVHTNRSVWHIGYQDVIAVGYLFTTGKLFFERVVALSGPGIKEPGLVRTRLGASIDQLVAGRLVDPGAENAETDEGNYEYDNFEHDKSEHDKNDKGSKNKNNSNSSMRIISGSVLDGRHAKDGTAWLGRFHNQVSALEEGDKRELLEFIMPGTNKFSLTRLYLASLMRRKQFDFTTSTEGSPRSIIPLGTYEEVMPLDILPTQLLRALVVDDFDAAIELGCLELDEEDLALCTFACPGKYEYGPYLRRMLTRIEAES